MKRFFVSALLVLVGCSNNANTCPDGGTCADATIDVVQIAPANFNTTPAQMVLDPGDSKPVVVSLDRGTFATNIDITVTKLPPNVTATPLTILPGSSAGTFNIVAAANVTVPLATDVTITATAGPTILTGTLHLIIGSVIQVASTSMSYVVPAGLTSLVFEVWGAGGGASSAPGGGDVGGGGGFAQTQVDVTPGETLMLVVGAGGTGGSIGGLGGGAGGAGGGYSVVLRGTDALVIAGGGGGAGGGGFDANDAGVGGFAGGAGGGAIAMAGGGAGGGGATDAGAGEGGETNGQNGGALYGGSGGCEGFCIFVDGGALGGGSSAIGSDSGAGGGGGGGGGYFGGGGGGVAASSGGGGGGGSAFASGSAVKLLTGSGQTPGGISAVGYGDAGVALGGGLSGNVALSGNAGLILVALPK